MQGPDNGIVLITGATGFVGRQLVTTLRARGVAIRRALRYAPALDEVTDDVVVGAIDTSCDFGAALGGRVDAVIHLAARVHVMHDAAADQVAAYRKVNVGGTIRLAEQAAASGVRRFVFVSSIKVNGEFTPPGLPFSADSLPQPRDPYGASKWEAEQALHAIGRVSGMEIVVIRPPLVYGAGVKANFQSIMRLLTMGIPLPLAAITQNRRSLVALDNLVDLIVTCLNHPAAANQTFLVSDGEDLSTADLLRRMGLALGKPARLFYVSTSLLEWGAALLRKSGVCQRLCGSLQLDISKTQQLLDWTPPVSVDEGLRRAAEGFVHEARV